VTETASERLVRLPFYNSLSESEQSEVVETIQRFDDWPR
jgi:dTDP-4-amino-4,6-dideoxygalactose transaminase